MDYLGDSISKAIAKILKSDEFLFRLIEKKFKEKGISLTEDQLLQIKHDLEKTDLENFQINLSKGREIEFLASNENNENLEIDIESSIELDNFESNLREVINNALKEIFPAITESYLASLKKKAPPLLIEQREERTDFTKLVEETWGVPLDLLEMLISASIEVGAEFNEQYRSVAIEDNDFVFEVLTNLHARGCQIGSEILLLLRNGFADGAHARWRTLHEISTVSLFISDQEQEVAERFLYHFTVYDHKKGITYQEHHEAIHYAPLKREELDARKADFDDVIKRFGKGYKNSYGWAAQALGKENPTFYDIEKSVELNYMRPFYNLANVNVHADSKGLNFRFGLPSNDNRLLAGASIFGLGEPGQNTAYSFSQLTATVLLTRANWDHIAFVSTMDQLKNEIVWAFDEVMEEQSR